MHLSKLLQCTIPRVNPNVNYRLLVIMIYQCRFLSCNKCSTFVQDFDSGGGCVCLWVQGVYGISLYFPLTVAVSLKFCCETLKNRIYKINYPDMCGSISGLYFILLFYMSIFTPLPHYFDYCTFVISLEIKWYVST